MKKVLSPNSARIITTKEETNAGQNARPAARPDLAVVAPRRSVLDVVTVTCVTTGGDRTGVSMSVSDTAAYAVVRQRMRVASSTTNEDHRMEPTTRNNTE